MIRRPEMLIALVAALVVSACAGAAADSGSDATPATIVAGVGELPGAVTVPAAADASTSTAPSSTTSTVPGVPIGAAGNRVLMIGDSILASTASRYGGAMCPTLVPLGWRVAVEAEVSRQISFARDVQRARLDDGWDAGLVFLGTNYGNDRTAYADTLERVVTEFGAMPVVLVNVTQRNDAMADVNAAIAEVAGRHPNVVVVDWRAITYVDPTLLNSDGIHPNDRGRQALVDAIAAALGQAPVAPGEPACLPSEFTDDAEGLPEGMMPTTTVKGGGSKPVTSTTAPRGGTTTTTAPRGGTTTTSPATATTTTVRSTTTTVPSSTPASSTPASSTPASSTPASSTPASSTPASSTPASSTAP